MRIEHQHDGDVHVVRMCDGENSIEPAFVERLLAVLDEVAAQSRGAAALVLTGEQKFFSNGLELDALLPLPDEEKGRFGAAFSALLGRLVTLPVPTVAAINGHAFAAGALLALACDYRLMRQDRGWICLSEVDAGVPISPAMMGLVRAKLPPATARDAVLEGHRYTADEAIAAGFADADRLSAPLST
jgi:enoyl-CoA hydratase/carnithine racemase